MKQHNMLSSPKQQQIISNATQKAKTILGKSDNKLQTGSQHQARKFTTVDKWYNRTRLEYYELIYTKR